MNIAMCLSHIIGSDTFANIISTLELLVAIIALCVGGKTVSNLISEFRERRMEATFGYYMNLVYYIKRIKPLVFTDDGHPMKTLNVLSSVESLRNDATTEFQKLSEKLRSISNECLQYLSSKENQIPPAETNEERLQWKEHLDEFVDLMNQFSLIGSSIYLPTLSSREGIDKYHKHIKDIFDYFERTLEQETVMLFKQKKAAEEEATN